MNHLLTEVTLLVSQYGLWIVFFGMVVKGTTWRLLATKIFQKKTAKIQNIILVNFLLVNRDYNPN